MRFSASVCLYSIKWFVSTIALLSLYLEIEESCNVVLGNVLELIVFFFIADLGVGAQKK